MKTKLLFLVTIFMGLTAFNSCSSDSEDKDLEIPSNVNASSSHALKVELSWASVANADSYEVYRADSSISDPEEISDYSRVGETETTSYDDLSVVSSSSYYYKVRAVNSSKQSEYSESASGSTIVITPDEAFSVLAEYTDGRRYDASSASQVPNIIVEIIENHAVANTDIVFLIDNTSSMSDDIRQVRNAINNIISSLPPNNRLGMAVYNDANLDPNWYRWTDLTTDYSVPQAFLNNISVYGGGDFPESVYDGIYETVGNMSWSSSVNRMILVIGDAAPLEGSLSSYTLSDVVDICTANSVVSNLYPILIED